MKYAKWRLDFSADPNHGVGPETIVNARGDAIEGAFYEGDGDSRNFIYGYVNDDFDFDGLDIFEIAQVSEVETLEKAQQKNNACYIGENGKITAPTPEGVGL